MSHVHTSQTPFSLDIKRDLLTLILWQLCPVDGRCLLGLSEGDGGTSGHAAVQLTEHLEGLYKVGGVYW